MSSVGQVVGGIAGAVIGAFVGGPAGAFQGFALGSGIGGALDPADLPDGPRLEDLRVQMSTYGAPIPFEWGCNRHAGTIIWPRILEAVEHEQTESAKGGPEQTTFTYTLSCAVLVCEGPIAGIRRIWANKKIIYDAREDADIGEEEGGALEGALRAIFDPAVGTMRIYLGTETQEADPLIEAMDGPSPAYRGYAYVVFEDYDVTEMNGRPPQWEFEVITEGEASALAPVLIGVGGVTALVENDGAQELWSVYESNVYVYNAATSELLQTIALPSPATSITVLPFAVWVGHSNSGGSAYPYGATKINRYTYAIIGAEDFGYGGSVSFLGTLTSFAQTVYSFINNGVGTGALRIPGGASSITVPNRVHQVFDIPERAEFAITGLGNWLVIASPMTDATIATITNAAWPSGVQAARVTYDISRDSLFWANAGQDNVYRLDLNTYDLTLFVTIANVNGIHYHSGTDLLYVDAGSDLNSYSPETGALIASAAGNGVLSENGRGNSIDTGAANYYFVSEEGGLWRIPVGVSLSNNAIPLSQIVSDICIRSGLEADDIDVTELTDGVDGYIVTRQMTARAAIEPLQTSFFFDAVESDDKIKFVKRDSAVVTTIPEAKRAAHAFGDSIPDALSIVRAFELEMPYQCEVEYPDVDADHLIGTQYDRRLTKASRQKLTLAAPIVMTAEHAKQIAKTVLYEAWQTERFRFTTGIEYAHLEPTDKVLLPTTSASYTARLGRKTEQPNGVIEWEAQITDLEVYAQTGEDAAPSNYISQTIYNPGDTLLELLDIPMLRDADNDAGFYVAMAGSRPSWMGAQLFRSSDGGANYDPVFSVATESAIGMAITALPDFTAGNIFDEGSTVEVFMTSALSLLSVTQDQVLNGSNKAVIGADGRWEVIHFKTATLIAENTYELSGLLRGCRGTEWATGLHEAGDAFVLASESAWNRINAGDTGLERLYKAPPVRIRLDNVDADEFTNTSISLKPFAPVDAVGVRDGSNNLTVTWNRRTRLAAGTLHLPVLLGEVVEAYSIDIMDGTDVVRTILSGTQTATYLASEQTADGLTPGAAVMMNIYQLSAAVGRGYPLEATL